MRYVGIQNSKFKTKMVEIAPRKGKKVKLQLPCLCADDCSRHFELLNMFDSSKRKYKCCEYYIFHKSNGRDHKTIMKKIAKFKSLYRSIRDKGYNRKLGHIIVSDNGARLDGSHRSSIIEHLKYNEITVLMVRWEDVFSRKHLGKIYKHIKSQQKKYNSL